MDDIYKNLRRRIFAVIRRGVIRAFEDGNNPKIYVAGSHARTPVELFQQYGIVSSPPPNSELVYFSSQGDEDLSYAVGFTAGTAAKPSARYQGDFILYGIKGQQVLLDEDGGLTISGGEIRLNGTVIINGQSYDGHTHSGVQNGGSTTGPVV